VLRGLGRYVLFLVFLDLCLCFVWEEESFGHDSDDRTPQTISAGRLKGYMSRSPRTPLEIDFIRHCGGSVDMSVKSRENRNSIHGCDTPNQSRSSRYSITPQYSRSPRILSDISSNVRRSVGAAEKLAQKRSSQYSFIDPDDGESSTLTFSLQALLVRHEAYVADAEEERKRMMATIEHLEGSKLELETENAKTIEENRNLLNTLEELNNTVSDSDARIQSLTTTLLSTQAELHRLSVMASRASQLEEELMRLEAEQELLSSTVVTTKADEKSALQRWKRAERALADLHDQVERIEREATEERERHVEVLGRLERRRAVERELDGAAGRLKGAAAATQMEKGKSSVVSHFVKDILQDNANLQIGIVELRDMLLSSNEEVEALREQLMLHQPIENDDTPRQRSLQSELPDLEEEFTPTPTVSSEVHVHHHYHAAPQLAKLEKPILKKRPKKKRHAISSGLFTPPPGMILQKSTAAAVSTTAAILNHTSTSVPPSPQPNRANRWSVQSNQTRSSFALSSVPSSPQSIFDRSFGNFPIDESRPTSPESNYQLSPPGLGFFMGKGKQREDAQYRSFSSPGHFSKASVSSTKATAFGGLHTTAEEADDEHEHEQAGMQTSTESESPGADEEADCALEESDTDFFNPHSIYQPSLRRSASHESILSVNALDLAELRSKRSISTIRHNGSGLTPFSATPYDGMSSSPGTMFSNSVATARPVSRRYDSQNMLSQLHTPSMSSLRSGATLAEQRSPGLGKRVGGWVWGKWGVNPAPTPTSGSGLKSSGSSQSSGISSAKSPLSSPSVRPSDLSAIKDVASAPQLVVEPPKTSVPATAAEPIKSPGELAAEAWFKARSPGVNQSGPIPGYKLPPKLPRVVQVTTVDTEGLKHALGEAPSP
jgi:hypothetical protein